MNKLMLIYIYIYKTTRTIELNLLNKSISTLYNRYQAIYFVYNVET